MAAPPCIYRGQGARPRQTPPMLPPSARRSREQRRGPLPPPAPLRSTCARFRPQFSACGSVWIWPGPLERSEGEENHHACEMQRGKGNETLRH